MLASTSVPGTSLAQIGPDQKLSEEEEILQRENVNLLQRQKELELQVQHLKRELKVCGNAKKMLVSLGVFLTVLLYRSSAVHCSLEYRKIELVG